MLVQREMEGGRAPVASITQYRGQFAQPEAAADRRKGAKAETATGLKEKGSQFGGCHSQQGARRSGKSTGFEKNIERPFCQATRQAAVAATSRWRIPAAAVASGVRCVSVSG